MSDFPLDARETKRPRTLRDAVLDLASRMERAEDEAGQVARDFAIPLELRALVEAFDTGRPDVKKEETGIDG